MAQSGKARTTIGGDATACARQQRIGQAELFEAADQSRDLPSLTAAIALKCENGPEPAALSSGIAHPRRRRRANQESQRQNQWTMQA